MRKRITFAAAAAISSLALFGGTAQAAPSACLHLNISINGQGQTQDICLPPA